MFTGLVEEVGTVRRLERTGDGGRLTIGARRVLDGVRVGDSIAVSGACLTVVAVGRDELTMDCTPETLSRTTLRDARLGTEMNLERSLVLGDRLGGHLVLGHVDAVAEIIGVRKRGNSLEVGFSLPEAVRAYVAAKGSVAIDGVSLTVVRVEQRAFEVALIPQTVSETTLRHVKTGLQVNVEADIIARYVSRALKVGRDMEWEGVEGEGLTEKLLREEGFT
jgi:riboflavin synthase